MGRTDFFWPLIRFQLIDVMVVSLGVCVCMSAANELMVVGQRHQQDDNNGFLFAHRV